MKLLSLLSLLVLLGSCSLLSSSPSLPSLPGGSPIGQAAPPTGVVTKTVSEATDQVWRWAWLSVLLVLVFPSARAPIVGFIKALFTVLALPLNHLILLYDQKFGNARRKE